MLVRYILCVVVSFKNRTRATFKTHLFYHSISLKEFFHRLVALLQSRQVACHVLPLPPLAYFPTCSKVLHSLIISQWRILILLECKRHYINNALMQHRIPHRAQLE